MTAGDEVLPQDPLRRLAKVNIVAGVAPTVLFFTLMDR